MATVMSDALSIKLPSDIIGIDEPGVCLPNFRGFTSPIALMSDESIPAACNSTLPFVDAPIPIMSNPSSLYSEISDFIASACSLNRVANVLSRLPSVIPVSFSTLKR